MSDYRGVLVGEESVYPCFVALDSFNNCNLCLYTLVVRVQDGGDARGCAGSWRC
jgi:hypothetical protein